MDHISLPQLEKYQTILDEIDIEFKKHKELERQLEKENTKLIAYRITQNENILNQNQFEVLAKVFNSLFDIFNIYSEEFVTQTYQKLINKQSNTKYYLIEVYIAKLLLEKFIKQNCILNICISNGKTCINKNVRINKTHAERSIMVVVPFDGSVIDCTIITTLYICLKGMWSSLKISTIDVNISHHFTVYNKNINRDPIEDLTKIYNNIPEEVLRQPVMEYQFKCKCSAVHMFEAISKNSYYRLDPDIVSSFTSQSTDTVESTLNLNTLNKTLITLNNNENILYLTSTAYHLRKLKKYFIQEIDCQQISINKQWFIKIEVSCINGVLNLLLF